MSSRQGGGGGRFPPNQGASRGRGDQQAPPDRAQGDNPTNPPGSGQQQPSSGGSSRASALPSRQAPIPSVVEQHSRRAARPTRPQTSPTSSGGKAPSPSDSATLQRSTSRERQSSGGRHGGAVEANRRREEQERLRSTASQGAYSREPMTALSREPVYTQAVEALPRGKFGARGLEEEDLDTRPVKYQRDKRGSRQQAVTLLSNYVRMASEWGNFVVLYDVQYEPDEPNRQMRRTFMKQLLEENYGINETAYVYNSRAGLYLRGVAANNLGESASKTFAREGEAKGVRCVITRARVIKKEDPEIMQLLNTVKNNWMGRHLGLALLNRAHFNPAKKINVRNGGISINLWPGFFTAVGRHDGGTLLNIDNRFKVVRTNNMLQEIDEVARRCRGGQQEVQNAIKEALVNSIVITDYSDKPRTYRVMDIDFNEKAGSYKFQHQNKEKSLAEYYKEKYNYVVVQREQPLLIAEETGAARFKVPGQAQVCVLIPELCNPTGLTDPMRENFQFMKAMADQTMQIPLDRMKNLYGLMEDLLGHPAVVEFNKSWGITFENDLVSVEGNVLRSAGLQQGPKKFTYDPKTADWTRDVRASRFHAAPALVPKNILLAFPRRFSQGAQAFWNTLREVGAPMGLMFPNPQVMEYDSDRDLARQIQEKADPRNTDMVVVILPAKLKNRYDEIKQILCRELPIISQCVVQKTLEKQQMLRSVATKIAIQVGAKLGGAPWALDMTRFALKSSIMFVGVDTYHDSGAKGGRRSAVAVVGAMDETSTRFSSKLFFQAPRQEIGDQLGRAVVVMMDEYKQLSQGKQYPEIVMFYRDGVGEGQLEGVYNAEVSSIRKAVLSKSDKSKVVFIVVTKRHNTRFFVDMGRADPLNPVPGTVVDSTVTKPNRMDFYIVAQTVRQGTVAPTHFNVLYDDSNLSIDQLQQLTYAQCCMYFNWSGTVKVPAPCQYAHKLAFLTGQSIHDVPAPDLEQYLYFL